MKNILTLILFIISSFCHSQTAKEYYSLGNAKVLLQDFRGAIQDYTKSIELDPKFPNPYYNRGNVKVDLQDYHGGIQDYTKAIDLDPRYKQAYHNRGIA